MAPAELSLIRSGRLYELKRDEEVLGEVRRRGLLKRRYEADFGGRSWLYVGDGRKVGVNRVFDSSGRECASLEASGEGYEVVLDDEPLGMRLVFRQDGTSEWVDERDAVLLRLAAERSAWHRPGQRVATLEETGQSWPGPDPDAARAVATATICAWFVQDLDRAGSQVFSELT